MLPRWVWDYIRSMNNGSRPHVEVRGWDPVMVCQRYRFRPTISDISSPCPTKRDVWLRRVRKVSIDHPVFRIGRAVHKAFMEGFRTGYRGIDLEEAPYIMRRVVKKLVEGLEPRHTRILVEVFKHGYRHGLIALGESIPVRVEPVIPGSLIGLSDYVKPDFIVGYTPVEIMVGNGLSTYWKEVGLTGYALAIEAWTGNPVDYGILITIRIGGGVDVRYRVVMIDDSLRKRFLDVRDEISRMIDYGEEPERPSECPETCPYREVCWG